jgi:perosamine synthetase
MDIAGGFSPHALCHGLVSAYPAFATEGAAFPSRSKELRVDTLYLEKPDISLPPAVEPPFLNYAFPDIGQEEIDAVVDCLRSGWITTGPRVKAFEAAFRDYVGSRHAVAVNSCTAALHLALEALGVGAGDEVLVPTMTFGATAEVVIYCDATPVLIDSHPDTLNIDVAAVRRYLECQCVTRDGRTYNQATGARVRAIIPVHYGGLPCDMRSLSTLATQYGLSIVEDCAHALPARSGRRHVGTIGEIGAFSFYANKTITTAEGGMLVTDDERIADRARVMCLHGISRDAWQRYSQHGNWYYEIMVAGFKYNMTDIAAAMGLVQLRRSHGFWQTRQAYAERYFAAFRNREELILPARPAAGEQHAWHLFPIRLRLAALTLDRATFMQRLRDRGIATSVHFIPLHLHPLYRDRYGYQPDDLPVAYRAYQSLVSLPIYSTMCPNDVDRVIGAVTDVLEATRR